MRKICDATGAYMMADIAHISGLVASNEVTSTDEPDLKAAHYDPLLAGSIAFRVLRCGHYHHA